MEFTVAITTLMIIFIILSMILGINLHRKSKECIRNLDNFHYEREEKVKFSTLYNSLYNSTTVKGQKKQ